MKATYFEFMAIISQRKGSAEQIMYVDHNSSFYGLLVLFPPSSFISHLCSSKSNMDDKRHGFCLWGAHGLFSEKWLSRWHRKAGLAMDTRVTEPGWWYRVSKFRMLRWQAMVTVIFIHSSWQEKKSSWNKTRRWWRETREGGSSHAKFLNLEFIL